MTSTSSNSTLTAMASIWSPMANFTTSLPHFSWSSAVTALTDTTINDFSDHCTETVGRPICAFKDATNYISGLLYGKKPALLGPKVPEPEPNYVIVTPTMNSTTVLGVFAALWATYCLAPFQRYQEIRFMKSFVSPIASFFGALHTIGTNLNAGRFVRFFTAIYALYCRLCSKQDPRKLHRELERIGGMVENLQNDMTQLFDTVLPMQEDINNTLYDAKKDMEEDIELGKRIVARHHDTIAQIILEIFRLRARMNATNPANSAGPSTQQQQPALSTPQSQLALESGEAD